MKRCVQCQALQRGGGRRTSRLNRFNGFHAVRETVETVDGKAAPPGTLLKRGVNGRGRFISRQLDHRGTARQSRNPMRIAAKERRERRESSPFLCAPCDLARQEFAQPARSLVHSSTEATEERTGPGSVFSLIPDSSVPSASLWLAFFCSTVGHLFFPIPPAAGALKREFQTARHRPPPFGVQPLGCHT